MNSMPTRQPAPPPDAAKRPWPPTRRALIIAGVVLVMLVLLGALAAPLALWAYDIERAGTLMDAGMAWPRPRLAASLPQARDPQALQQALPWLQAAARHRPTHAHAYRLIGQVQAALGDWDAAAAAYEQARSYAPGNPLIRWEASQVYQQMDEMARTAPRHDLLGQLAAGQLSAPGSLIKSLFCTDQGAASCYRGRASYRQPYAADPLGPQLELPALFLHPPASVAISLTVPAELPALHFVAGLDPAARAWNTDGAIFRVWVTPPSAAPVLAAELPIDRETALRGWVPGWADLTRWAGQTITLTLESNPGAPGDATDDWYAWGDPALTTVAAARAAVAQPALRAQELRAGLQ